MHNSSPGRPGPASVLVATSLADRGQVPEDAWLVDALTQAGARSRLAAWDDPAERWDADAVVIRSTWGYQHHLDAFHAWLDQVGSSTRLLNPAPMVRANIDKVRQLRWLDDLGVPHVPSTVISDDVNGADLIAHARDAFPAASAFVLKPTVSASGHQTVLLDPDGTTGRPAVPLDEAAALVSDVTRRPGHPAVLVQPFHPEIEQGELALVFFAGRFSHAFLRFPAVLHAGGASRFVADPPAAALALAERILGSLASSPTYARIDLIEVAGQPVVMEVELAEPALGIGYLPSDLRERALGSFVAAILQPPA